MDDLKRQMEAARSGALAVAAPMVAVSIIAELANALIARSATPAHVAALLAPLRSIVILVAFALLFERMTTLLAQMAARSGLPPESAPGGPRPRPPRPGKPRP